MGKKFLIGFFRGFGVMVWEQIAATLQGTHRFADLRTSNVLLESSQGPRHAKLPSLFDTFWLTIHWRIQQVVWRQTHLSLGWSPLL